MDIKEKIEKEINNLWKEFSEFDFTNLPPLAPKEIFCTNSILFIGINPSISDEEINRLKRDNVTNCEFYPNHKNNPKIHKYYKKFIDISEKTNLDWEHIDLLYIRETQQKKINKMLKTKEGIDFIYKQLLITNKILQFVFENEKPKMIVVNNSLSRVFLGKDRSDWLNFDLDFDNKIGTSVYKNIPFFFTSMLTGQRALDLGSYERLIWHINKINEEYFR